MPACIDAVGHLVEPGVSRRVVAKEDVRGVVSVVVAGPDYGVGSGCGAFQRGLGRVHI